MPGMRVLLPLILSVVSCTGTTPPWGVAVLFAAVNALRAPAGRAPGGRDWRLPFRPKKPAPPKKVTEVNRLRETLLAPVRFVKYCYAQWTPTLTRTLITCSCGYCAWVAYLHDRDVTTVKTTLSSWKSVPASTVKTLKPALQQTTTTAVLLGKKTRTDLVPALAQCWTAAEPFVKRAGTATVGLMADGAAFTIDVIEDFRIALKRKRAKRRRLLGLPFAHPARQKRRSRYDRAAEISEKITDAAADASSIALNTSKVATRWLGKAGKTIGKATKAQRQAIAAQMRNDTRADGVGGATGGDAEVDETGDDDVADEPEPPAEELDASPPATPVAPPRRGLFSRLRPRRRRTQEDDGDARDETVEDSESEDESEAESSESEVDADAADDDERGDADADDEAEDEEETNEAAADVEDEADEADEIYSSDAPAATSGGLAKSFLAQVRLLKEIIQLTTAPPAPPAPEGPTLAAAGEDPEVYFC